MIHLIGDDVICSIGDVIVVEGGGGKKWHFRGPPILMATIFRLPLLPPTPISEMRWPPHHWNEA